VSLSVGPCLVLKVKVTKANSSAAGMTITDSKQRVAVFDLLESLHYKSGWPGQSLGEELKQIWEQLDQTEG
jgi:hypothetical protein